MKVKSFLFMFLPLALVTRTLLKYVNEPSPQTKPTIHQGLIGIICLLIEIGGNNKLGIGPNLLIIFSNLSLFIGLFNTLI